MSEMPVFVKIFKPVEINEFIISLKNQLDETQATLNKIKSLSSEESSKISEWKSNFNTINKKIDQINTILLEPETI